MSSSSIVTDVSRFPLVVVTLPSEQVSDGDIDRFVEDQRALLARRDRHYVVADASNSVAFSAAHRRRLADWLEESESLALERSIGMGIVIANPIIRGAVTAVFWLKRPPMPTKLHATVSEAVATGIGALEVHGINVPQSARDMLLRERSASA